MHYDNHLDKVLVQKHATLVSPGSDALQRVAETMGITIPDAVAMKQSGSTQVVYNETFSRTGR